MSISKTDKTGSAAPKTKSASTAQAKPTTQPSPTTKSIDKKEPAQSSAPRDEVQTSKKETEPRETVNNLVDGISDWGQKNVGANSDKQGDQASGETTGAEDTDAATSEEAAAALELGEGELLSRFSDAPAEKVTQLQEMLKGQGVELAVDGKFGPETQDAVREYQRQNGLKVDGIVGPETQGALNGGQGEQPAAATTPDTPVAPANPATPGEQGQLSLADPNMSPQEQYEHYKGLIEANGGQINAEGPTVLGMRGLGVDGVYHDSNENVGGYNDTFVVLDQGPDGKPVVQTFQGATHANQRSSGLSYGPDENGRTIRGVAQLRPGTYDVDYATGNYQGYGAAYHVKTQSGNGMVPAFRDLNADGTISTSERNAAIDGGYRASAILFHNGKRSSPSSIGCQTIIPSQHDAFSNAIGRNGFSYTLVDANNGFMPAE